MLNFSKLAGVLTAAVFALMWAVPAQAQATRTWVSGVGDDANPCSRTAPCKTFAGAISKTATNGEINCLDPGGFGAVTITKSIAIICDNTEAGVLVSVSNGVNVNGAGAIVYLSGLDFEGLTTGSIGINFIQGAALHVTNCVIRGFRAGSAAGIVFGPNTAASLFVNGSTIVSNGTGGTGGGISVAPVSGGSAIAVIDSSHLDNNSNNGLSVTSVSGSGGNNVTVVDSTLAGNTGAGVAVTANSGTAAGTVFVNRASISFNANGISSTGALADALVASSLISRNTTNGFLISGGLVGTFTNNAVAANAGVQAFNQTVPPT